ncbi:MAG: tRNA (adenosine(37)-N6)-threonylcarbamoyltransferase complex ATPase subunit type 1 TsaE [Coriobacteriia bacterium]|nr:tRNA (adenosine(37)-N6)-threonylcarbamoyltransferase complex ATPase subunit type 1 TsaE [Coriobacteriia bacterium]
MPNAKVRLLSLDDTLRIGQALGESIQPGTVIVLSGDLGAGKTQLASAIAQGMGISETITSPTFAILKNYTSGRIPLNHMDIYRLETVEQLDDLDFWDLFSSDEPSATLIEWGGMFDEVSNKADLIISLSIVDDERRCMNLQAQSAQGEETLSLIVKVSSEN